MDSVIVVSQSMSSFNIAGLDGITEFAMGSALGEMTNHLVILREDAWDTLDRKLQSEPTLLTESSGWTALSTFS